MATPNRRLAPIADAARYVPCSPKTIRRRIAAGQLPAFRSGRLIRVDLNDVDAMLKPIPTTGSVA